jgi:HD-GYP domain-containing protein (c-di-GMP phosphodiesterase class II)
MDLYRVKFPIHTLEGKVLVKAGSGLTSGLLDEIIHSNQETWFHQPSLLEYGNFYNDFAKLVNNPPYDAIFDYETKKTALRAMGQVCFVRPILDSLDYFRKHDFYTYRHYLMVFALSSVLPQVLYEKPDDWLKEGMAGSIHDIGKICVPLEVLRKSTPLTHEEREYLEHHCMAGYVLLSYYLKSTDAFAVYVARDHHERRDGSGYPRGVPLTNKLIEIVAVCDIYDALLSPRPYRWQPYDNRATIEILTDMAVAGKFSMDVIKILIAFNRKGKPDYREINVSMEKRGRQLKDNLYGTFIDDHTLNKPNKDG